MVGYGRMNNTPTASQLSVRSCCLILVMILSSMTPIASAQNVAPKFAGATLSENPEDAPLTYSFSPAIRAAFARVSDLSQYSESELESTSKWVVVSSNPIGEATGILANTWYVEVDPSDSLQYFSNLQDSGEIEVAYPLVKRQMTPKWIPNDSYFTDQWHLQNTGQENGVSGEDVNITGAWNDVRGTGIVIGIVDDGLEWDHADLSTNYESSLDYDYCNYDGDPTPSNWDAHGTAAAGVAAATGNNGLGVSGSAPDASLAGLMLIACGNSDSDEANTLSHLNNDIDIYSNSWGPSDDGDILGTAGPLILAAFEDDAYNGRNGLGNIITWAAGNGLGNDDDSNLDAYANSRFTISVTAVGNDGEQTNYGEPGANVLISSPSSDGNGVGITTTDLEGNSGYTSGDYTSSFGGTSSATPLVSGIIALMLEANSNLTWRDVQQILVESARTNDPNDSGWNTNGAGFDFNHKYGFGVIDAGLAVNLSKTWTQLGPEVNISSGQITVSQSIPDNAPSTPVVSSHVVAESLIVESVEVIFDADHTYRSDLDVTLISPDGTESELVNYFANRDSGDDYNEWLFSSVQHWGEVSAGTWTLEVYDDGNQDVGTWNHWELIIHGTEVDLDSDGDGITDSNETDVYGTNPDNPDTDYDGLSDYVEVFTTGTNATDADTDDDFLSDGVEININNTDPFDNDTDGDGLTDGLEVLNYFTDPLVADPDADADSFYWFQDCNDSNDQVYPYALEILNGIDDDCDNLWDEGYNTTDEDSDNLSDYSEYHIHGTNLSNFDTDGDLLSDGDEVLIYFTDPLVKDNDSDFDGWYWFEDCDDNNSAINPDIVESLDGIDNNCRDGVDEDFIGQDSDSDGLLDLFEFNNMTTNPFDPDSDADGLNDGTEYNNLSTNPMDKDSDGDGLEDGEEVLQTLTDPLVPDLDNDSDGFRWFEECDDSNPLINPNQDEFWNGIDDDCDEEIDELVDRLDYLTSTPEEFNVLLNATSDNLELSISIDLNQQEIDNLNLSITWLRNSTEISTGKDLFEPAWTCDGNQTAELGLILCNHTGFIGPWIVSAVISDGKQDIYFTWYISYEVWHPPEPVSAEEDETESASEFQMSVNQLAYIGVGAIIVILLAVLLFGGKRPPKSQQSAFVDPRYQSMNNQYSAVPSAPTLPPPPGAF
ncbi:MAG: hypothetical protein DWC02_01615 [Candidatus Poseidoniales archaeon]|nr:MAG: hypothetical protein DWC02_01615 [Candidatus Poseidoniales archaeon]